MMAMVEPISSASSAYTPTWKTINWNHVSAKVKQLQMRIAKAIREKRYGKVKALQRLLSSSFYAKLLAVKRVTENKGSKTAGVDGQAFVEATNSNPITSTLKTDIIVSYQRRRSRTTSTMYAK